MYFGQWLFFAFFLATIILANILYWGERRRLSPTDRKKFDQDNEDDRFDNPAP